MLKNSSKPHLRYLTLLNKVYLKYFAKYLQGMEACMANMGASLDPSYPYGSETQRATHHHNPNVEGEV